MLDACVWGGCMTELERSGHDVEWVGDWPEDPGDQEILRRADRAGRVVVTIDKDFGELGIVRRIPHHGIVRLVGGSVLNHAKRISATLDRFHDELLAGAIVTVELSRVRIRGGSVEE